MLSWIPCRHDLQEFRAHTAEARGKCILNIKALGCWLLSETCHNVSDQTSKTSQDFLIFMTVCSSCRIDSAIPSCSVHHHKWFMKHSISRWMTESPRLLSHSVFHAYLEYFGIFWIRKVQSHVLNVWRIEREISSLWWGSPWCCIVHVCITVGGTNVLNFCLVQGALPFSTLGSALSI